MSEERAQAERQEVNDLTSAPIRSQLLWASLFPLVLFGLLTTLVIATLVYRLSLSLVMQRNTAQVQVIADRIAPLVNEDSLPGAADLQAAALSAGAASGASVYLIDAHGVEIAGTDAGATMPLLSAAELKGISQNFESAAGLLEASNTANAVMVSAAPVGGSGYTVILVEPWAAVIAPASSYQLLLAALTILGIVLSLATLSLSIGRIIRPIQVMAENASGAVPGSIFHPMRASGPQEIRALIDAFNKMVIRLAEQQSTLRDYAHKAMLSQEEERQRLSHELHDGTLQDLVGLSQRVELCRDEIKTDPQQAGKRLDEIHGLLKQTLDDVRRISIALRPPVLEDFGLTIAIDALCKDMNQYKPALTCEYLVTGTPQRLAADMELAVYRVVQEALANIRKHAPDATLVKVTLEFNENDVLARVSNDGGEFANQNIQEYVRAGHLGLAGMYERARLFGGKFSIDSDMEHRTVISIQLPLSQA
jgi:signal transduction histidine kinase